MVGPMFSIFDEYNFAERIALSTVVVLVVSFLITKACPNFCNELQEMASHLKSLSAQELIHKTLLFKDWDVVSPMPWKPGKLDLGFLNGFIAYAGILLAIVE